MRHQAEILSEVITILSIKSSLKKSQHSKWKTCLVKNIIAAKCIHYLLMKSSVSPHFYKKIWVPPLLWFLESLNSLLNKGVGGSSHYKWCANDITIYSKKIFLSFSINKKFLFPPCATSYFWNFEIPLFTFLLIVLYPFPYSSFWGTPFASLDKGD